MTGTAPPEYAGPVSRTIAYGLDTFLVAVTFTGGVVVVGLIASVIGAHARDLVRAAASAYLVLLPLLFALYCAVFWALAARTLGMALVGVRVVATSGGRPSWLSALVRGVVLAYFPLGAVWALVDRRHQAVHDKLARTVVVRLGSPLPPPRVAGVPAARSAMAPSIPRG
jgi:uncharacterized RDD family membrane protein YckC